MSDTKHTPEDKATRRPWIYQYNGLSSHVIYSTDGTGRRICEMQGHEEMQPNAKLIVTAVNEREQLVKENEELTIQISALENQVYGDTDAKHQLQAEKSALVKERDELRAENERCIKSIGAMLIALNECGREIHWNTSTEIEEAYAEHSTIYESTLQKHKGQ